ncbi:MAG: hypothetical protein ACI9X0_000237 [Kiritimatiellia bacterium]|jgi:hypothetical protein
MVLGSACFVLSDPVQHRTRSFSAAASVTSETSVVNLLL